MTWRGNSKRLCRRAPESAAMDKFARLSKAKLGAHQVGELFDGVVGVRCDACQEVENMLHAGVHIDGDVDPRLARPLPQPSAVVEQRLVSPDLDVDGWQPLQVSVDGARPVEPEPMVGSRTRSPSSV